MNKYKVIAICGKSASGKDTLLREIVQVKEDVHKIINCTTRPPREGEKDGQHYFFLTLDELQQKYLRHELLEASEFRGWGYGTSIEGLDIDKINIGVFNPTSIQELMKNPLVDLYVVNVEASGKTRLIRSLNREHNPDVDEIIRRYIADEKDFANFSQIYEPDYVVLNEGQGINPLKLQCVATAIVLLAERHWAEKAN